MYVCMYAFSLSLRICMYVCMYVFRALYGEGRCSVDAGLDQRPAGVTLPRYPAPGHQAGKPSFRHSRPGHFQDHDHRFRTVQNE